MPTDDDDRLLRRAEVERLTGLSRSAIYQKMKKGEFPAPKKVGPHAVRWLLSEIRRWIDDAPYMRVSESPGRRFQ